MLKKYLKAIFHRWGWQITRRPRPSASKTATGPLRFGPYSIQTDNEALRHSYAEYPETNQVITRLVAAVMANGSPASMIDIGANCGDSAALAKCGGEISILCVEGDPRLCQMLHANLAPFREVTVRQAFLGETPGKVAVNVEKAGWNNTLVSDDTAAKKESVTLDTLDHLASCWPDLERLRFIKCDTEGYDVRILLGGRSTLASRQPVLLFEYNREAMSQTGESGFRVFQFLQEINYRTLLIYDAFGRFICATTLENIQLLRDLHEYADGRLGKVYYYDILAFARADEDLAEKFLERERQYRGQ